jgi:hypothetical protein
MSDAGDEIKVEEVEAEPEVAEAPKGKLSVEDALQVRLLSWPLRAIAADPPRS